MSEKVKNSVLMETSSALKRLDGTDSERYKFSSIVMYTLSKNMRRINEACDDLEKTRVALVRKHGLGQQKKEKTEADNEAILKFQEEWELLINQESEIVVSKIKLNDLNLEVNNIPITVLSAIGWLILD